MVGSFMALMQRSSKLDATKLGLVESWAHHRVKAR